MNKIERIKMVKSMEFIARQINDEHIFFRWLVNGVPDGDIDYGDLDAENDPFGCAEYLCDEDDSFAELMNFFLHLMAAAKKSGGLYCDDVCSEEAEQ